MITVAKSFDAPIKLIFPQDLIENGLFAANKFAMLGLGMFDITKQELKEWVKKRCAGSISPSPDLEGSSLGYKKMFEMRVALYSHRQSIFITYKGFLIRLYLYKI